MPDDRKDMIDLLPHRQSNDSVSGQPEPDCEEDSQSERRDYIDTLFITFGLFIVGFILFICLKDLPGGIQVVAMVAYTVIVLYIASNQFRSYIPWERLTCRRALLAHCLALAIVCGFTTEAFALRSRLPDWFLAEHRKGSLFYWCFAGFILVLAFCEWSWISRRADLSVSDVDEHR